MNGKLYVVATPIGNLKDISPRAVEVLRSVAFVLCEDTRVTSVLLSAFQIKTALKSCFEYNEDRRIPDVILALQNGKDVALVSDAGTPAINDPGFRLINACYTAKLNVVPIPGPSAFVAALSICGFPISKFEYIGFLSVKSNKRTKELADAVFRTHVTVCYESPHRILKTLSTLLSIKPDAEVFIAREITKRYEETLRGTAAEVFDILASKSSKPKGEFVIVFRGSNRRIKHSIKQTEKLSATEKAQSETRL